MIRNVSPILRRIPLSSGEKKTVLGVGLAVITLLLTIIASWITHVIVCIQTSSWILLVVGIFVPPIGWVHGIGSWFGLF